MRQTLSERVRGLYAQMVGEKASPEFIAKGWAIGMFVGCAVPFGFQLVLSVPAAYCLKGSRVGAVVGTFITNPLTIFIIYPLQTWLADHLFLSGSLSYAHLRGIEWTWQAVQMLGTETLEAFLVGGFVWALITTPVTYWSVRALVRRARALKSEKI